MTYKHLLLEFPGLVPDTRTEIIVYWNNENKTDLRVMYFKYYYLEYNEHTDKNDEKNVEIAIPDSFAEAIVAIIKTEKEERNPYVEIDNKGNLTFHLDAVTTAFKVPYEDMSKILLKYLNVISDTVKLGLFTNDFNNEKDKMFLNTR